MGYQNQNQIRKSFIAKYACTYKEFVLVISFKAFRIFTLKKSVFLKWYFLMTTYSTVQNP